jgi:hydroxyacylglutathione hydrolase
MLEIQSIQSLQDNYIWLIRQGQLAIVVDPGEAAPVIERLHALDLTLAAILVTHYHSDHVGGISELIHLYPQCRIFAPDHAPDNFPVYEPVHDKQQIQIPGFSSEWTVWHTPGHTSEHVVYWNQDALFCGDTLFSAGCGRVFTGTYEELYHSLTRLTTLGDHTLIYPAHEYTLNNLRFCYSIEPHNPAIQQRIREVSKLRQQGCPTIPVSLETEKTTNVFLRTGKPELQRQMQQITGEHLTNETQMMTILRKKKDFF